jgi:hypothetical protein
MNNRDMRHDEARLNVTWAGQNGDLPDPVPYGAAEGDIRQWAAEAIRTGGVAGIRVDVNVNLRGFVVDRFGPNEARPYNLIQIRPKTPFGAR